MLLVHHQNDEIPESETGPTVQVAEQLSREGSPVPQDNLAATQSKEGPNALSTPPPEAQSPDLSEEPKYVETGKMKLNFQLVLYSGRYKGGSWGSCAPPFSDFFFTKANFTSKN